MPSLIDPNLIKIRTFFRELIYCEWQSRLDKLHDRLFNGDFDIVYQKINDLKVMINKYPIICSICGKKDRDLVLGGCPPLWYCKKCNPQKK